MTSTMHDIRLQSEARERAARAVKLMLSPAMNADAIEAAIKALRDSEAKLHDLITARLRGGQAGARPRVAQ